MNAVFRLISCWFRWFPSFDRFPSAMSEISDLKSTSATHAIETASNLLAYWSLLIYSQASNIPITITIAITSKLSSIAGFVIVTVQLEWMRSMDAPAIVHMYNGHEWNQIEIMIQRPEHSTDPKSIWFNVEIRRGKKHTQKFRQRKLKSF